MLGSEREPVCAGQLVCSVWTARPTAAPERVAHAPGTGEGARSVHNVMALMNTLSCLPTEVWAVPCTN